ncbi:3'-5' exonuclease [bacterium]|nr:MAG: 3'-5' exonuclease [bacterium]
MKDEMQAYISVDVETAGPIPSRYALLSIGACTLGEPRKTFYVELQPDQAEFDAGAMSVHGLDADTLRREGLPPKKAMERFAAWLKKAVPEGQRPLFCAFNAPFDWMFINDYFLRYTGGNPFGHSAIDIKAVYMGAARQPWKLTSGAILHARYIEGRQLSHNALQDAVDQAVIFEHVLAEMM